MAFEKGHKLAKGGVRPNAGRKTDKDIAELQRVMDTAMPFDDRVEIFRVMAARSRSGDVNAARLVLGYLYGTPVQRVQDENGGMVIQVVRIDDGTTAVEAATSRATEDSG